MLTSFVWISLNRPSVKDNTHVIYNRSVKIKDGVPHLLVGNLTRKFLRLMFLLISEVLVNGDTVGRS